MAVAVSNRLRPKLLNGEPPLQAGADLWAHGVGASHAPMAARRFLCGLLIADEVIDNVPAGALGSS